MHGRYIWRRHATLWDIPVYSRADIHIGCFCSTEAKENIVHAFIHLFIAVVSTDALQPMFNNCSPCMGPKQI
jgi:hypothetical protein